VTTMVRVPNPVRVKAPSVENSTAYTLLPLRFLRFSRDRVLLVSDLGEYALVSGQTFEALVDRELLPSSDEFRLLESRLFVARRVTPALLKHLGERYKMRKAFLAGFTKLHIFVVTLRCDHSCLYCQVSRQSADRLKYDMSLEAARRSIDLMFRSPADRVTMEFQGGEPLLNWDLIASVVPEVEQRAESCGKRIDFVIATNLALITEDILDFCKRHQIRLSTSLDGPAFIHNANRPRPGHNSYEVTVDGVRRARNALGPDMVSALMTTSRLSLEHPVEIIDEYVHQDFRSIFLRPISPYGFAQRTRERTGYDSAGFINFYKTGLAYILELNRTGTYFEEVYAKIILAKILTPFPSGYVDLQTFSGLGASVAVYNYDGDVYASDESRMLAEMGDKRFRLGNVHENSYEEIFTSPALTSTLHAASIEALPGCADCAFQPYCGVDPVYHHAVQGDVVGHRPTSEFHQRNLSIIRLLFEHLLDGNEETRKILLSWVTEKSIPDIMHGEFHA
jgi:uncharacterized protein